MEDFAIALNILAAVYCGFISVYGFAHSHPIAGVICAILFLVNIGCIIRWIRH